MSLASLAFDALRASVILFSALAAVRFFARKSAGLRRNVLVGAMFAVLVAPLAARAMFATHAGAMVVMPALTVLPFAEPPVVEPVPVGSPDVASMGAGAPNAGETSPVMGPLSPMSARALATTAWIFGVAIVLIRLASGLLAARRLARRASVNDAKPLARVIERSLAEARVDALVAISDDVTTPSVAGVFFPTVLMPRVALGWTEERWRVVLLHELAHVRGKDCLVGVVAELVCAAHWFDPMAWMTRGRWRKERELAADEAVIASGVRPSDYARHLLDVASAAHATVPRQGVLAMAGRPSDLARRLEAIVRDGKRRRSSWRGPLAIALAYGALTLAVACARPAETTPLRAAHAETGGAIAAVSASNTPGAPGADAAKGSETANASSLARISAQVAEVTGAPTERHELTIDPRLQRVVDEEVARIVATSHARAATAIVLDPKNGEILALADPDAARTAYITGSTMKAITIAEALDEGVVRTDQTFDCNPRPNEVAMWRDVTPAGNLNLAGILELSSNVGAFRVYQALGDAGFDRAAKKFGFDDETPTAQLRRRPFSPAGAREPVTIKSEEGHGAVGDGLVTTPLQMIAAYAIFANGGEYIAPSLIRSVRDGSGRVTWRRAETRVPAIRAKTASAMLELLESAVDGPRATGKAARIAGVRVAGKTGTSQLHDGKASQLYASFIGIVPADTPRYVILVGVVDPDDGGWGGTVAAPAFARIATRALSGAGVPAAQVTH